MWSRCNGVAEACISLHKQKSTSGLASHTSLRLFKVFAYLKKRDDISAEEFRDYYENNHVPLVLSFAPMPGGRTKTPTVG